MGMNSDTGGAVLRYVTRSVIGTIFTERTKFDTKKQKNVKEMVEVVDPVIVFMPNKSVRVMPQREAEALGLLEVPDIINFEAVTDKKSVAGKFKFAFTDRERMQHWKELEQQVISRCIQNHGYPIPREATISEDSIFYEKETA